MKHDVPADERSLLEQQVKWPGTDPTVAPSKNHNKKCQSVPKEHSHIKCLSTFSIRIPKIRESLIVAKECQPVIAKWSSQQTNIPTTWLYTIFSPISCDGFRTRWLVYSGINPGIFGKTEVNKIPQEGFPKTQPLAKSELSTSKELPVQIGCHFPTDENCFYLFSERTGKYRRCSRWQTK